MLVPLALTAFGLVMVYSATSASAALGNGNPIGYLERQGVYALIGIALMIVAARTDFRKLRALAPALVIAALGLCAAVLVSASASTARGAGSASARPRSSRPSSRSSRSSIWCAAYLARKPPPRTLKDLARPIGMLVGLFCLLILVEPDLGTVITIVVMVGAMLLVAGTPLPTLADRVRRSSSALARDRGLGVAVPPRAAARLPRPVEGPDRTTASRTCRR